MRHGRTLVGFLVLAGLVAWLLRGGERGAGPSARVVPTPRSDAEPIELVAPTPVAVADGPTRVAKTSASAEHAPLARAATPERALVRGRLVIAESGAPLDEVLQVRLRNGNVSLIEAVETASDGTFVSTLAFPSGLLMVKILRADGERAADVELGFDPAVDEEWIVPVPWPTFVHGRVVDDAGAPLAGLQLSVSPATNPRGARGRTRGGGEFLVKGLRAGCGTLQVARGLACAEFALDLRRGPNELGELRVTLDPPAGDVAGTLRAPGGEPDAMLLLVDRSRSLAHSIGVDPGEDGDGVATFRFADLPRGEYALAVIALDGRRYAPPDRTVTPPATELEFVAVEEGRTAFAVLLDAEDFDPFVLVRVRGQWMVDGSDFDAADVERAIVLAAERRPALVERRDAPAAPLRLERGAGRAFLFYEAGSAEFAWSGGVRGRPLAGVTVRVDGRAVACSDTDGLALAVLAAEPGSVEVHLPGWRVHAEHAPRPGLLTMVTLERE